MPNSIRRRVEHRPNLLRIVDNISWLTADKILRMGLGLVIGVLVARHLGREMFGVLSFALAFVSLFGPLASLGLKQIVVRDLVKEPGAATEILGTAAALRLIAGLLTYGLLIGATPALCCSQCAKKVGGGDDRRRGKSITRQTPRGGLIEAHRRPCECT